MQDATCEVWNAKCKWYLGKVYTYILSNETYGVDFNQTKALEITAAGVKVTSEQGEEILPADTVVLAAGSVSYNPLAEILEEERIAFQVVGDAGQVGLAFDAVHQGFRTGCEV